ncbi:ABC transporter substrate-binding protein [Streptomyces sp. NPDC096311]|uniref:ABC transporter substrate-binding protein n=1 Tax=Streptomyces sp. NPDC096311 TaxID=3366083 RepID=UPI0038046BBB
MQGIPPSTRGRTKRNVLAVTAVLAMTGISVAGCSGSASNAESTDAAGAQQKTLNIVVPAHAAAAPLYIALEKGYLKEEGLDVKISPLSSLASAFPALATGKSDVLFASISSGAVAVANGQKFKLIAESSVGSPGSVGVVTNDPKIKRGADLVGKKIASPTRGGVCDLATNSVLSKQGVDTSKIQWVELPVQSSGAALERGDVDAVCAVEPAITQLKQEIGADLVVDSQTGEFDKMPDGGYFVTEDFAKRNPQTIAAFRRALARGVADAKADKKALRKTIADYSGMPTKVVNAMTLPAYVTGADPAQVQRVLDMLKDAGALPKPITGRELVVR